MTWGFQMSYYLSSYVKGMPFKFGGLKELPYSPLVYLVKKGLIPLTQEFFSDLQYIVAHLKAPSHIFLDIT